MWSPNLELSELCAKMKLFSKLSLWYCVIIIIKQTNEMAWSFRCRDYNYADSIIFILKAYKV